MNRSTPGLPVHHHLPEFTQTHIRRVSDAIQPYHPLSSPSSPAFNLSQHQGLFKWVSSSHQVTKISEFQLQHQSFQWTVQFSSVAQSYPTLCYPMNGSTPGLPVYHQLPEFTEIHVHQVSDAIQPSHPRHPLLLLPPIPPSIKVFSNESTLHMRWPKYWNFSFSIIPFKEGLISFRMGWLDISAVQGTLKSLLQHHSSKPSILLHSAFFIVQLSHPYMTTGKTIALTRWTFLGKIMSPLFINSLFGWIHMLA